MTAEEVLGATFEALARSDAQQLARLAEAVQDATIPESPEQRAAVRARFRALGRLLQLTRRNLWLLRGDYQEPCGYGALRH